MAHVLLPFSLLGGIPNVDTSRFTFGLAIGWYTLAAILDYRWLLKHAGDPFPALWKSKFLYPTFMLLPPARHEHYGLMLLVFGPLGLIAGQWLKWIAPRSDVTQNYALPAYLMGDGSIIVGTMLVTHGTPLLALALLFDPLLLVSSAWLFRSPLWGYTAAAIVPVSLLLALPEAGVASTRQGWWLIGLASIYLMLAWVLRRVRLTGYSGAPLTIGFALIALGLPPSSQDQTGALWGYGAAAVLYLISAFWLRQPLLLTPASALVIVPYAISLQKSSLLAGILWPGPLSRCCCGTGAGLGFGLPVWGPERFPVEQSSRLADSVGQPLSGLMGATALYCRLRPDPN